MPQQSETVAAWIWKHLYLDGTGLPDYAVGRAGARIVHDLTSPTYGETTQPNPWAWSWKQPPRTGLSSFPPPESAISSDTQPGSCWPMRGNRGTLGIALARPVAIASFTIDHIPRSIAINPSTAPRSGELWGVLAKDAWVTDAVPRLESELFVLNSSAVIRQFRHLPDSLEQLYSNYDFVRLGSFAYDLDYYLPFQTFHLPAETSIALGDTPFDIVLLAISDNWGDQEFTCLYRVRVHPK
ncbi:hypothetical protein LXA43DRAFT_975114 [Ganoderma leucocontextum]|nr:hypothetical protein LXA43DRAFT_975114 [Ganoderma leucocontextum]